MLLIAAYLVIFVMFYAVLAWDRNNKRKMKIELERLLLDLTKVRRPEELDDIRRDIDG